MTYNWKITLWKGIKYGCFYGIPFLVASFINLYPEYAAMTVGSLLTMGVNYMKHRN